MKTARAEGNLERQKNAHALLFRRSICFSLRNDFKTDPDESFVWKADKSSSFCLKGSTSSASLRQMNDMANRTSTRSEAGEKTVLPLICNAETIILPRQARDKSEKLKHETVSDRAMTGGSNGGPVHEEARENSALLDEVCFIPLRRERHEVPGYLNEIIAEGIATPEEEEPPEEEGGEDESFEVHEDAEAAALVP